MVVTLTSYGRHGPRRKKRGSGGSLTQTNPIEARHTAMISGHRVVNRPPLSKDAHGRELFKVNKDTVHEDHLEGRAKGLSV